MLNLRSLIDYNTRNKFNDNLAHFVQFLTMNELGSIALKTIDICESYGPRIPIILYMGIQLIFNQCPGPGAF